MKFPLYQARVFKALALAIRNIQRCDWIDSGKRLSIDQYTDELIVQQATKRWGLVGGRSGCGRSYSLPLDFCSLFPLATMG